MKNGAKDIQVSEVLIVILVLEKIDISELKNYIPYIDTSLLSKSERTASSIAMQTIRDFKLCTQKKKKDQL